MTDWLDELYRVRRKDEEREGQKDTRLDLSVLGRRDQAVSVLRVCEAHKLLRRVNEALLNGKGFLKELENSKYDQAFVLTWQGSITKAHPPRADDPDDCFIIMVAAKGKEVFVNHKHLKSITPESLKAALVHAAKNPLKQSR